MLKSCRHPRNCLYARIATRRFQIFAPAVPAARSPPLVGHSPISSKKHDDWLLRNIFDSPQVWHDFLQRTHGNVGLRKGLFQNRYLTQPSGFHDFTRDTLQKCSRIVTKVLAASSTEEYTSLPQVMDRLSDSLCRVLDIAEFVRSTHPSQSFQQAANETFVALFEYMNVLNTTPGLNTQLRKALESPEIASAWGEEEKIVARNLLKDFDKSAIHLPREQRVKFVQLSSQISRHGMLFLQNMGPARSTLKFSIKRMKGMNPILLSQIKDGRSNAVISTLSPEASAALRTVEDEGVRKGIYIAGRTAHPHQIHTLETFLQLRAEVANLSGYQSYAEMNLFDKMAKSPEAVKSFLTTLSANNSLLIKQELDEMVKLKSQSAPVGDRVVELSAWDREFYRSRLATLQRSKSRKPDFVSAYFSLGTVIQGLSRLFNRLYGVYFLPHETAPGETWNADVRRLDVLDENEGHIAVLYCDLFARQGKSPNPTHFTLRCSRRITDVEISESAALFPDLDPASAANDGMATSLSPTDGILRQIPTIAIICDFQTPKDPSKPTLLSFREVQTLFHEMGHAIHSILGRTNLHVVSGTRCATDFAELPSVLMEHFASDPHVLQLFARHWETDKPLPYEMIAEQLAIDRSGQGADTEAQIQFALLDQAYHSIPHDSSSDLNSTNIFHSISSQYSSIPEPPKTTPQAFFGHLVEYGGTYYSYLFDRCIAGKIWKDVFQSGKGGAAVNREHGQRFREEVLKWGGSRDGWSCVAGVLGNEKLSEGGPEAMAEVGRWGVRD